ncbi:MAG: hypothetical protein CVT95_03055 [Bacteroidetes bacterium HGW-Bacteroidetes-12]|nr:MAG: hypothetical protein CVT95_03055 [Bacteroidetes bacterium HGW-Bacteroidetes-12]
MRKIIYISLVSLLSACYYNADDLSEATQPNALTYNKDVKAIIERRCNNCHAINGTQKIELPFYSSFNKVKNEISGIQSRALNLMDMPESISFNGPLTQGEKDTLQLWINQGALE